MDVEDYLNILRRNVGWIVGPLMAGLVIAVVVAFFWPDTYISRASIRVVPPQVPERLFQTNVNVDMTTRVDAMTQTILSRTTLQNIINTYDLYRDRRNKMPMEDIMEDMKRDIGIHVISSPLAGRGNAAFQISFSYEHRYIAQRVTNHLMNAFIDENIRERSSQSQMTTQFIREQYEQAKAELEAIDQRLTAFRLENLGRMPDEIPGNVQQITAIEARIASLNSNISRTAQEKMMLESEMRGLREKLAAVQNAGGAGAGSAASAAQQGNPELARIESEINSYERGIEKLLLQYTPSYPDVQKFQAVIEQLKKEREQVLNRQLAIADSPSTPPPAGQTAQKLSPEQVREIANIQSQIERVQAQIRGKELETDNYIREISQNEQRQKSLQARIERGPVGAQQLEQLRRDHELVKGRYEQYQRRLADSEAATELEQRKQSETLEVLDYPNLPESPAAPNRPLIVATGAVLGLFLGAGLVVLRELKDTSLKTLKDIRAYTRFNVLGSVPLLENDMVVRRRRRIAVLAWSTATVLSLIITSGSVYFYVTTKL